MTEATLWERSQHRLTQGDLGRRLVHVSGMGFPALYALPFVEWWMVVVLMMSATAVVIAIDTARLRFDLDLFLFDYLRDYETNSPGAYLLYMISATSVAVVFEPRIAIPAILMLAIGDPVAGIASGDELRLVKRPRALVTMFLICALLSVPFLHEEPLAVVFGGLGGMVADGIKPDIRGYIIDDDATIAPAGAIGIWLGLRLGGII